MLLCQDCVATVPTVYGIETMTYWAWCEVKRQAVATVPTVYGIETPLLMPLHDMSSWVATVPTVYGIETLLKVFNNAFRC